MFEQVALATTCEQEGACQDAGDETEAAEGEVEHEGAVIPGHENCQESEKGEDKYHFDDGGRNFKVRGG